MKWRNPDKELPEDNQIVWVMLEPHKDRGSLLDSAPSIEIVCGWVETGSNGAVAVQNYDELGLGSIMWILKEDPDGPSSFEKAFAWLPKEEMVLPQWN